MERRPTAVRPTYPNGQHQEQFTATWETIQNAQFVWETFTITNTSSESHVITYFMKTAGLSTYCNKGTTPSARTASLFKYVGPTSSAEAVDSARRAARLHRQQQEARTDEG